MVTWQVANAFACIVAGITLASIVLHPRINEGLVVKAGLVTMIMSLAATAMLTLSNSVSWEGYWRAAFLLRVGLAITCVGIVLRAHEVHQRAIRRSPDLQRQMTNRWLNQIIEPVHDLVHLFREDEPSPREREKWSR